MATKKTFNLTQIKSRINQLHDYFENYDFKVKRTDDFDDLREMVQECNELSNQLRTFSSAFTRTVRDPLMEKLEASVGHKLRELGPMADPQEIIKLQQQLADLNKAKAVSTLEEKHEESHSQPIANNMTHNGQSMDTNRQPY